MKYNGRNIITDQDITLTGNGHQGENLSDVLSEQEDRISDLEGNIKWIYKYGGIGSGTGSGGSGGESGGGSGRRLRRLRRGVHPYFLCLLDRKPEAGHGADRPLPGKAQVAGHPGRSVIYVSDKKPVRDVPGHKDGQVNHICFRRGHNCVCPDRELVSKL